MSPKLKVALGPLGIVLLGIAIWLGLSYFFMLPPVVCEFQPASAACLNNRRQIEAAIDQWAMDRDKTNGDVIVLSEIVQYFKENRLPTCPDGGTYVCGVVVGQKPICSLQNMAPTKVRMSPFLYKLQPDRQHYRQSWE